MHRNNTCAENIYDNVFYEKQAAVSYSSARVITKIINKVILPKSVIDIGCGVGTWLKAWMDNGVNDVKGYDINVIKEEYLCVARNYIIYEDIYNNNYSNHKADLAMSLEVAEHLYPDYSKTFVSNLAKISDFILFSAGIPGQAGANHINTQPLQYWVDLFKKEDYNCYDFIRWKIINNNKVAPWYKQNILLFARGEANMKLKEKRIYQTKKPYMFYDSFFVSKLINKLEKKD